MSSKRSLSSLEWLIGLSERQDRDRNRNQQRRLQASQKKEHESRQIKLPQLVSQADDMKIIDQQQKQYMNPYMEFQADFTFSESMLNVKNSLQSNQTDFASLNLSQSQSQQTIQRVNDQRMTVLPKMFHRNRASNLSISKEILPNKSTLRRSHGNNVIFSYSKKPMPSLLAR